MNPNCKDNIESPGCQQWLRQVYVQCNRLLSEKELEFWNDWWVNRPLTVQLSYDKTPHLMTSEDCVNLKHNFCQNSKGDVVPQNYWQVILLIFVIIFALLIIFLMAYLLNKTLRNFELDKQVKVRRKRKPRSIISITRPGNKKLLHKKCNKIIVQSKC